MIIDCKILLSNSRQAAMLGIEETDEWVNSSIDLSKIIGVREYVIDSEIQKDQCVIHVNGDCFIVNQSYGTIRAQWLNCIGAEDLRKQFYNNFNNGGRL